jgi:hypothetical protein
VAGGGRRSENVVLERDRVLAVEDEFLGALVRAGFHFDEPDEIGA